MSKINITYYLDKLFEIDKQLGGRAKIEKGSQAGDEFSILQEQIKSLFFEIRNKINEKSEKLEAPNAKAHETMKIDMEIKNKLNDGDVLIGRMNEVLRKLQKKGEKDLQQKETMYKNLKEQLENLKAFGEDPDDSSFGMTGDLELGSEGQMRQNLLGNRIPQSQLRKDATEEEKIEMQKMKQTDKQIDELAGQINENVKVWKQKVVQMGEAIETSSQKIDKLTTEVDKANSQLESQNKRLKDVVTKVRSPSRFCLDIILIVILVGLGFYIVKKAT